MHLRTTLSAVAIASCLTSCGGGAGSSSAVQPPTGSSTTTPTPSSTSTPSLTGAIGPLQLFSVPALQVEPLGGLSGVPTTSGAAAIVFWGIESSSGAWTSVTQVSVAVGGSSPQSMHIVLDAQERPAVVLDDATGAFLTINYPSATQAQLTACSATGAAVATQSFALAGSSATAQGQATAASGQCSLPASYTSGASIKRKPQEASSNLSGALSSMASQLAAYGAVVAVGFPFAGGVLVGLGVVCLIGGVIAGIGANAVATDSTASNSGNGSNSEVQNVQYDTTFAPTVGATEPAQQATDATSYVSPPAVVAGGCESFSGECITNPEGIIAYSPPSTSEQPSPVATQASTSEPSENPTGEPSPTSTPSSPPSELSACQQTFPTWPGGVVVLSAGETIDVPLQGELSVDGPNNSEEASSPYAVNLSATVAPANVGLTASLNPAVLNFASYEAESVASTTLVLQASANGIATPFSSFFVLFNAVGPYGPYGDFFGYDNEQGVAACVFPS